MNDINHFLETKCGFNEQIDNVIEKELQTSSIDTNNNKEKYIQLYENNFIKIQQLMDNTDYINGFYLYLKGVDSNIDNIKILDSQIQNIKHILENKRNYYINQNEEIHQCCQDLQTEKTSIISEKDKLEIKHKKLILDKFEKEGKKIEKESTHFDIISKENEIDKITKNIKFTKEELDNIPNTQIEIENKIFFQKENIDLNNKCIEILESFPRQLYIQYLEMNYYNVKNRQKEIENINYKHKQEILFYYLLFLAYIFYIHLYYHRISL